MKRLLVLALGIVAILTTNVRAAEVHVNPGESIQAAINAADTGDVIIVHMGTYLENINFSGKGITVKSTNPDDPNVVANSIIDGNSIDTVVKFSRGEDSTSILNGFTLQNGSASEGGGIYCGNDTSPSITNCIIMGNSVSHNGGGIYCSGFSSSISITNCIIKGNSAPRGGGINCGYHSSPNITNCTITGNSSTSGGGIYCYHSSPGISNCTISHNSAPTASGGGIYCWEDSSLTISNCTITANSGHSGGGIRCSGYSSLMISNCTINENSASSGEGGGIYCDSGSSLTISDCTISANSAHSGGGITCSGSSSLKISNCTINDNPVSLRGGGILCSYASLTISNCIIKGNSAPSAGGIVCYDSSPTIIHCTITANLTPGGSGICLYRSFPIISNCILWNDSPGEIYVYESTPGITYSNIKGGYTGVGNIDSDPMFVDSANGDYHLQSGSPCIDTADPNSTIAEDKDGVLRPQDGDNDGEAISDMGAYEYIPGPCEGDFDGDGDVDGTDLAIFAADFGRTDCPLQGMSETIMNLKAEIADLKSKLNAKNKQVEELQEHIEAMEGSY